MNISVPVNPSCVCLLSSGGLYIDSAYYQPQTIAAPIIIHLGPQDLFWPHWCTATGLGNSLDLPFNPSPLLNSVSESQLLRCCSPGLHLPHETQQQYWKQYGGENTSGNTLSSPGWVSVRRSLQPRLWLKETPIKTRSNTSSAYGEPQHVPKPGLEAWKGFCWNRRIHSNVNDCL